MTARETRRPLPDLDISFQPYTKGKAHNPKYFYVVPDDENKWQLVVRGSAHRELAQKIVEAMKQVFPEIEFQIVVRAE